MPVAAKAKTAAKTERVRAVETVANIHSTCHYDKFDEK
jgi:hypothetical protein